MTRRRHLLVALTCLALVAGIGVAVMWQVAWELGPRASPISGLQVDHEPLEKAIERAASERPTQVVDMAEFVRAEWDELLVFGGYSTGASVSHEIGHDWGEGRETEEIAHEHENAIVFLRRGEVVAWLGHLTAASFDCLDLRETRSTLRFYVREWIESGGHRYRLAVPAVPGGMRSDVARACVDRHGPLAG